MIPLFIQLTFTKHLHLYFIYLFPHIKNKEVYKILLESQVKEKSIAYTKWGKCLKKDRMHTLTCITQTLFFIFNYLELNKLKIFKWKLIHFILPSFY
jgi:hypothetical protein